MTDRADVENTLARYRHRRANAANALERAKAAQAQGQDLSAQIAFGERMVAKFDYQIDHCTAILEGRELTPEQQQRGRELFGADAQED